MAKKPSLMSALATLPEMRTGKRNWIDRLAESSPDLYREIIELVDSHIDGKQEVRRKLPTETAVCKWLAPIITESGCPVKPDTIGQLFRKRRSERNGS